MTSAVAAGMGLSFKDTSTALAVFAQNGLKGSDAGTSLKTMLSRLVPMTDGAYTTMESLGLVSLDTKKPSSLWLNRALNRLAKIWISTSDGCLCYQDNRLEKGTASFEKAFSKASIALGVMDNKFFDAQGNIKSMTEISGELSKALDGMSAKDKQEALYKIFGSDAIREH
ncbi:phage tail tape measure protein [Bacillus velezensis]|nr:phage tail tape measure protein [Bacillus velezensis]